MKKLFTVLSFFISANSIAATCSTSKEFQLPQWTKSSNESYRYFVSNISNSDIDIEIKLFDSDNDRYIESSEPGTQFIVASQFTSNPIESPARLLAGHTGNITINRIGANQWGTAKIIWQSEACLTEAIQVSVRLCSY